VRLTILHTNDIHGRQERIAQIATLVRAEKAATDHPVLYLDAGDVEETTNRLSNLTKGTAMHRLLSLTSCDAHTVGNACWLRYGAQVLAEHARAATYPLLLANFGGVDGPVPSVLLGVVGVVGATAPFQRMADDVEWGFERLDVLEVVRREASSLRARGARLVVLLSHLGLEDPAEPWDDRRIARELQDDVDVIIGAHTHDLLPQGERIGRVLVAQAGDFGDHIGRIEIDGGSITASVAHVPADTEACAEVEDEIARIDREVTSLLAEPVAALDAPLDAGAVAAILRTRAGAEVGIFAEGQLIEVRPPGVLTRGELAEACDSGANPGVVELRGAQLRELIERAAHPLLVAERPRALRGRPRGRLGLDGVEPAEIEPGRVYTVAGTDWELEPYGGLVPAEWGLEPRYEFPLIVREAIEEHLRET
jgi:2',3'-cyclic-nucleotide 2'-phosphodiesterase (5'-nucleotidase family)